MTYGGFLAGFVVAPTLAVAALAGARRRYRKLDLLALGATLVIACVSAFPWDNYAVEQGYWRFDPAKITGVHLKSLPIEECSFFALETLLVAAVILPLLPGRARRSP